MTEEQKRAINALNRMRESMTTKDLTEEEYFLLMDFIVKEPTTKIEYVPQPTIPWTTPDIRPYYGSTGDPLQPPYKITCELSKD